MVEAVIRQGEAYAPSFYVLLAAAGLIGAVGLLTNSQILIVGAMVVFTSGTCVPAATEAVVAGTSSSWAEAVALVYAPRAQRRPTCRGRPRARNHATRDVALRKKATQTTATA